MNRFRKRIVWLVILIGMLGIGAASIFRSDSGGSTSVHTVPVKRGDRVLAISATGTVEPEEVV
ncbi:MAG: RND transporter, partial [Desulforhabdus sp.]|nr:RND transporter [Desulforhabdus sp.]